MRTSRVALSIATSLVVVASLAGCAANESTAPETSVSSLTGTLNGAGASSQGSAQEAWVAGFQTSNPDVTINYDPSGSGAGRKAFIAGGVQFAGSDSALTDEELGSTFALCATGTPGINIPVYVSPIAVVYNVAGVTELNLDADTLAKIFAGTITTWNDPAIVALNPKATLPAASITAVHRSDDSGTTKNFTDYLYQVAPNSWTNKSAGIWPLTSGEGANGTSGVIDAVSNGSNTIGYADLSKAGKLSVANIKVGSSFVAPSAEGAANTLAASEQVTGRSSGDLTFTLNRTTTDSANYPLLLVSYLITCQEYKDAAIGTLVNAYASYLVSPEGQQIAADAAGAAPLTGEVETAAAATAAAIK